MSGNQDCNAAIVQTAEDCTLVLSLCYLRSRPAALSVSMTGR